MIHTVILPQLAMGMSEGTVVEWLVEEGGFIEKEADLAAIETEKVVNELPAPHSGYVHYLVEEGTTVDVEIAIAQLAESEEEYAQLLTGNVAAQESKVTATEPEAPPATTDKTRSERIAISPAARKEAQARGLDISTLKGSGPNGRIVMSDVEAAAGSAVGDVAARNVNGTGERRRIPLTGIRKTIAQRMIAAHTEAAMVCSHHEVDVTSLIEARQGLIDREAELGTRVSWMAFYAKALAEACQASPLCNSTLENDEIILWESVNVAFAVALKGEEEDDASLITPVIRDVASKDLVAVDKEIKRLAARARKGELERDELTGGTINLSSTAGFFTEGWMAGTALLNLPMTMSVCPGTAIKKPLVVDDEIAIRWVLPFGITFDHRAFDGEPAGRFSSSLGRNLKHPDALMVGL
ncbi:MAG: dihydrolipoamide acetyltransferase family protein [Pseudomonadota bacterium]